MIPRILFPTTPPANLQPAGTVLAYHAQREGSHPALTFNGETLSRAALERRANRRARAFQQLGVEKDDFVVISLPNGIEIHETALAVWKLGATPMPVSYRLPDAELEGILELAQPQLVVGVDPGRLAKYRSIAAGFLPNPGLSEEPLPPAAAKHFKVATSSGSTGRPKLIVDAKPAMIDPMCPMMGMEVDDVCLMPSPLYHNGPFTQSHLALFCGAHLIEMSKFDAVEWLQLIEQYKVKWAYLVPTLMKRVWDLPNDMRNKFDVSSLELAIHMAAPCPAWLKAAWIEWLGPDRMMELYATSEGSGGAYITGREALDHPGSVGRVYPGTEGRVLDADGNESPPGEVGEIFFRPARGPGSTYQYIGATAKAVGEWESCGDMGHFDEEGFLYISDRRTDMVVSGGANIYPAEVEAALDAHPGITESIVVGLPDADFGQRLHAVIIPAHKDEPPSAADLQKFLEPRLARYKWPYTVEFRTGTLKDEGGKVRRSRIREEAIDKRSCGEPFARLR